MISHVTKGDFTVSFPLAWISGSFDLKKYNNNKNIALNIHLLLWSESMNSLCPLHVYMYVHSQRQEEKPVYLYTMASDWQTKESKALGLGLGWLASASTGVRVSRAGASRRPLLLSGAFSEHMLLRPRCVTYGLFPVLALLLALLSRSLSRESQLARASAGSSFRICSTVFW